MFPQIYSRPHRVPVQLPACGHTFCKPCLKRLEKERRRDCSVCREPIRVKISQLSDNYALLLAANELQVSFLYFITYSYLKQACHQKSCNILLFLQIYTPVWINNKGTFLQPQQNAGFAGLCNNCKTVAGLPELPDTFYAF